MFWEEMTTRKVLIIIDGVEDVELFVDGEKICLNEFVVKISSRARLDTRDNFG
jgi:hypothetical protein